MFRRIFFVPLLWIATVYYSYRMMRVDPGKCTPEEYDYWGLKWGEAAVKLAGIRIEADLDGVDPEGHYVFICNHQSNLDIPVLFEVLKGNRIRFVAKKSLFEIPIYGNALAHAGHICIDRENRRSAMKSLNEAVEKTKEGFSPVIFPEGTRNRHLEELMEFKVGGHDHRAQVRAARGAHRHDQHRRIMPKGRLTIDNRPVVRVKALPFIDPARYTLKEREQFKDDLHAMMNEAYKELLAKG